MFCSLKDGSAMRGWALLALLCFALGASAQEPAEPIIDPNLLPVQFTDNVPRGMVNDPATPVVRIQVRAPAHLEPNKPLEYKFIVTNTSSATAYGVVVRHPLPKGAGQFLKSEPTAEVQQPGSKDMTWTFAELPGGKSKEIIVRYNVAAGSKEVQAKAFVKFEHGQAVTTELEAPKLAVKKFAPEKANANEPITVRVEVTNTSRVTVKDVDHVEDISPGFEFIADDASDATPGNPLQRTWRIKELGPQQTKVINYRVKVKGGVDFAPTSHVKSVGVDTVEPAKTMTKIVRPGFKLVLEGPQTVAADEVAKYRVLITNTGNTPLNSVRITATLPPECRVTSRSANGQATKNSIVWDVPTDRADGPLAPGATFALNFALKSSRTGKQKIEVAGDAGRLMFDSQSTETTFSGSELLRPTVEFDGGVLTVGKSSLVTYSVKNLGSEMAKNVVLMVDTPMQVAAKQVSPNYSTDRGRITFKPVNIPPGDEVKFSITYEAMQDGRAAFDFSLSSDGLTKPLTTQKAISITR
jgi:uncharacterized repeat protein (TIGR01451 family)